MKKVLLAIVIAGLTGVTGCSAPVEGIRTDSNENYIKYHSAQMRSRVKLIDLKSRRVGDILQASAELKNGWDNTLDFQYKFKFFDKDGFEVGVDSRPWTPITLIGQETANVQAVAPNPSATSFKIYIQD